MDDLSYSGHLIAALVWLALAVLGLLIALTLLLRMSNSPRGTWLSAGYLRWEADVLRQRILDGTVSRVEGEEQLRHLRIRVQLWERTSRQQQLRVRGKKYSQVIDNRLDKVPRWAIVRANQFHPLRNQIRVEELLLGFPFRLGWPVWIAGVGPLALALLLLDAIGSDAINLRVLVLALVVFAVLSAAGLGVAYVWLRAVRRLAVYSASVDKQEVFVLDEILDEAKIALQTRGKWRLFRWLKLP
ncbi:hypothetical protein [Pseudoclavibacter helvolus]|uniref:hypothetical protein n=1 Tax=Pseudoclavibacter helvolus TaxID=255205 RepID=UPI003C76E25F